MSTEFQKVNKEIATFLQRKNRKQISLNFEMRKKERIQDKIEEKKAEEVTSDEQPDGPIFPVSATTTTRSCGSAWTTCSSCSRHGDGRYREIALTGVAVQPAGATPAGFFCSL